MRVSFSPLLALTALAVACDTPDSRLPNVVFPGVIEYVDLHRFLAHLDVGIVPHSRDLLTESMNPLKVYNYVAAGLYVVGTDVPNLDDVTPFWNSATPIRRNRASCIPRRNSTKSS